MTNNCPHNYQPFQGESCPNCIALINNPYQRLESSVPPPKPGGSGEAKIIQEHLPAYTGVNPFYTSSAASKNDQAKPDHSLITKVFLDEVSKAMMVGEKKYGRYNYCKGHSASQLIAAIMRHTTAYFNGEDHDPVDGQHHLGSVAACVNMLLRQQELGTLNDNRYKAEKK